VLLRSGARQTARTGPARAALLGVQFAASLTLLGVGGLFVRSLRNVRASNIGFDAERTIVAVVDADGLGLRADEAARTLERAADRLRRTPGLAGVGLVSVAPFRGAQMEQLGIPGRPEAARVSGLPDGLFYTLSVDTAYFRALGVRLLRGRAFAAADGADTTRSAPVLVSETFARRVWPGADPLGRCLVAGTDAGQQSACMRVVGVVSDVRFLSPTDPAPPLMYHPLTTYRQGPVSLLARVAPDARGEAAAFVPAVRAAVLGADPRIPFVDVGPVSTNSLLSAALDPYRVSAAAFTLFGALALALAAVGLYGVVAYAVAQRAGEFGVRTALGARGRDVAALVLGQGLRLVALGGAAGALGAVLVGRLLRAKLYGVGPLDPVSLGASAVALAAAALLASWLPARRAARVDPATALRAE
jgi:predicted permease